VAAMAWRIPGVSAQAMLAGTARVGLRGVLAGEMELALEIGLGHFEISHSHADIVAPQ